MYVTHLINLEGGGGGGGGGGLQHPYPPPPPLNPTLGGGGGGGNPPFPPPYQSLPMRTVIGIAHITELGLFEGSHLVRNGL